MKKENQVCLLFKDITSCKKLQSSTLRDNFTNVFINSSAHNASTPINGMKMITELLAVEVKDNHKGTTLIQKLRICLQGMVFNSQNIIELSKIRLGKFLPTSTSHSIKSSIKEVLSNFKSDIKIKKLNVNVQYSKEIEEREHLVDKSKL